eukprot:gb/GECG01008619.1/.p1 GENE.gb/GECG01008619.1/~~gb/GECG01008619.1/.p1  ORF type:complete len:106 (+),score=2.75 gb/GECG01008619.1/:1-318(+)
MDRGAWDPGESVSPGELLFPEPDPSHSESNEYDGVINRERRLRERLRWIGIDILALSSGRFNVNFHVSIHYTQSISRCTTCISRRAVNKLTIHPKCHGSHAHSLP